MPIPASSYNSDVLSDDLLVHLTTGKDFTLPVVDLADPRFDIPSEIGNDLYAPIGQLSEADLTTRTVGGSGVFDGLMQALAAHLTTEYDKGRITGKEYAEAYVSLTTTALNAAVQFVLGRDQAHWQAQLIQKQARAAEVEAVKARLGLETTRAELAAARANAEIRAVEYAIAKLKLAIEDENYGLLQSKKANVEADTSIKAYQLGNTLPAELGQIQKQTAKLDYELVNLLPKEVLRLQSQIDIASAQISEITARKDQVLYETAAILPARKANTDADTAIKTYQLSDVYPSQVALTAVETATKTYQKDFLLPVQKALLDEQVEAERAKTMDVRSDGVTPVTGAIGKTKDLQQQQIDSYQRDAEAKVAKMFVDTWITQKTIDEGLPAPASLAEANVNIVMDKIRTNLNLV